MPIEIDPKDILEWSNDERAYFVIEYKKGKGARYFKVFPEEKANEFEGHVEYGDFWNSRSEFMPIEQCLDSIPLHIESTERLVEKAKEQLRTE